MAVVLEAFRARPVRPAIVSVLAALGLHAAIAIALPRARAAHASELWPRAVEVDFAEPPPIHQPPPAPPAPPALPDTPTPSGAAAGGGATSPVARAPAIVTPPDRVDEPRPEAPIVSGDPDLPLGGPPAPASGGGGGGGGGPAASSGLGSGPPGPPGPPSLGSPPPPPPPAVDRSRTPSLVRGGAWSCPWPAEAEQIDDAIVVVTVVVDATGRASRVEVSADPGYGFGREARRCALREAYVPGLDRDGRPIASVTRPIRVRFSR